MKKVIAAGLLALGASASAWAGQKGWVCTAQCMAVDLGAKRVVNLGPVQFQARSKFASYDGIKEQCGYLVSSRAKMSLESMALVRDYSYSRDEVRESSSSSSRERRGSSGGAVSAEGEERRSLLLGSSSRIAVSGARYEDLNESASFSSHSYSEDRFNFDIELAWPTDLRVCEPGSLDPSWVPPYLGPEGPLG